MECVQKYTLTNIDVHRFFVFYKIMDGENN